MVFPAERDRQAIMSRLTQFSPLTVGPIFGRTSESLTDTWLDHEQSDMLFRMVNGKSPS